MGFNSDFKGLPTSGVRLSVPLSFAFEDGPTGFSERSVSN